jgi:NADPH-dependent curcumin reductase CurA
VIGSASTDAKVEFMRSIGADAAFNYKTTSVAAALKEHGPIDLFFDNVGGDQLEAALENMNMKGRVIVRHGIITFC